MEQLKDEYKSIHNGKMTEWKIMAKYMNNRKNYETHFQFFCWAIFEINVSNDRDNCSKFALVIENSLFQKFLMLQASWKNYGQIC